MFGLSFLSVKVLVIGLVVAFIAGYIGFLHLEVNHYKTKANDIELQYTAIVKSQATRLAALEAETKAQDAQRQADADEAAKAIEGLKQSNLAEIKAHEAELRSCKLSATAVSVFNSPTGVVSRPEQKDSTGQANKPDASTTSTVGESPEQITLADLLTVNEINKANFESMRETILAWQKLWQETERNLNGTS